MRRLGNWLTELVIDSTLYQMLLIHAKYMTMVLLGNRDGRMQIYAQTPVRYSRPVCYISTAEIMQALVLDV